MLDAERATKSFTAILFSSGYDRTRFNEEILNYIKSRTVVMGKEAAHSIF